MTALAWPSLNSWQWAQILALASTHALAAAEAEAFVQCMRILRAQQLRAILQFRVRYDAFDQPFNQAVATMFRRDDDVANPGERCIISECPRETHLCSFPKQSEAK